MKNEHGFITIEEARQMITRERNAIKINIPAFVKAFNASYDFLYSLPHGGSDFPGYHEAVAAFDAFSLYHKPLLKAFITERGDAITSDREAAAFMYAYVAITEF